MATLEGLDVAEVVWCDLAHDHQVIIETIYHDIFPPEERRPLSLVMATGCRIWLARHHDEVIGFATAIELESIGAGYLQYIGVSPSVQSSGAGSALLSAVADTFSMDPRIGGILLEIEDPFIDGATVQAKRRALFYKRWGARPLDCLRRYFIADFENPKNRIPMTLLWKPLRSADQPRGDTLRAAVAAIFESEYADVAGSGHLDDLFTEIVC